MPILLISFDILAKKTLQQISLNANTTGLHKAQKFAEFTAKFRKIYSHSNFAVDEVKDLDFYLAKEIIRAESFSLDEMQKITNQSHILSLNSASLHIKIDQYKDYVLSFINKI